MSKWIDKFNTHPVVGTWKSLVDLVCDINLASDATDDSIQDIARLRKVIIYLNGIFENIDPEITPFIHLSSLHKTAQNCVNEINSFKGNKNPGHLTNVNSYFSNSSSCEDLTVCIRKIIEENEKIDSLKVSETVSSLKWSNIAKKYISLYQEI